jgi:TonB-linked SusC/RagA family outer membrane protein
MANLFHFVGTRKYFPTFFLLIFALLFGVTAAVAQSKASITGKVLDDKTKSVAVGATVRVTGSAQGVIVGADGAFSFSVLSLPVSIEASLIGYRTLELDVYEAPTEPILIYLVEDLNVLDEVVVTGYTTQERKAISGAISSITFNENITNQAGNNFTQLLQGKVPGVQVVATSGLPGGGISFLVRGNNSINASVDPLYVIDGVFLSYTNPVPASGVNLQSNPLADLNPNDIESISILKDANATAIYGSQGANGVVIITTKRGKLNAKSRVNVQVSHGWANAAKRFETTTGPETGMLLNEIWTNTARDNGQDLATYLTNTKPNYWRLIYPYEENGVTDLSRNAIDELPTYDRISDLFQTARQSDYQVSVQGGNASSNHYVGIGYADEASIVRPAEFQRFSARVNYDNSVTQKLKWGTSFSLSRTQRTNVYGNDNNPGGVINSAIFPHSFLPEFDKNGNYLSHNTFNNHLKLIEHVDNRYVTWRSIANLYGEYAFLPELKLRSSWSFDYVNNTTKSFSDSRLSTQGGNASASSNLYLVYTAEQLLTYAKSFGQERRHNINVLLGNTVSSRSSEQLSATGIGYLFDQLKEVSSAATTDGATSSTESRLASFFGKAGYGYAGKYTVDFSLRADGSSRFGKNRRWGYFPSFGATWNAGQEAFIRHLNVFDALKFRGSFGYSGNQNGIDDFVALGTWSAKYGYLDQASLAADRLANPDLTWEMSRQIDFGVDFSLLNNRLNVNFDIYQKYTYNMLLAVTVPSRSGYSTYTQNYGELSNKGVELSIESQNFQTRNFRWQTAFNISANRNRIEKIPQEQSLGGSGRGTSILREGESVNSFFLYKQLYVDPQTGNAVYDDVNVDNRITYADRQIVGSALPDFTGGVTNVLSYKNFELNAFFYFSQGNEILSMHDFFLVHGGTMAGIGFIPRQLERWQNPGDVTDIPRLTISKNNPDQNNSAANNYTGNVSNLSSRYVEDGSYLRLKNLSLSYTVPRALSAKLHAERIKATVSATNLWTLTSYRGLDPEVSAQSADQNTAGYDWATIPQPRTFQVILNITL